MICLCYSVEKRPYRESFVEISKSSFLGLHHIEKHTAMHRLFISLPILVRHFCETWYEPGH